MKILNRCVALLLISCLVADPAMALSITCSTPMSEKIAVRESVNPLFTQEAFAERATQFMSWMTRHPEPKIQFVLLAVGLIVAHLGHPRLGHGITGLAMMPPKPPNPSAVPSTDVLFDGLQALEIPPTERVPTRDMRSAVRGTLELKDVDDWIQYRLRLKEATDSDLMREFNCTATELLRIPRFGQKSLDNLKEVLDALGYPLLIGARPGAPSSDGRPQRGEVQGFARISDAEAESHIGIFIQVGRAIAVDLRRDADFYFRDGMAPEARAEILLQGVYGRKDLALKNLTAQLTDTPGLVHTLREDFLLLQRTTEDSLSLRSRRYVIALPENPVFGSGMILAYQGRAGRRMPSIYLGSDLLRFMAGPEAPARGLRFLLEHENHHLEGNPQPDFSPPQLQGEPPHSFSSREEFSVVSDLQRAYEDHQRKLLRQPVSELDVHAMLYRVEALGFVRAATLISLDFDNTGILLNSLLMPIRSDEETLAALHFLRQVLFGLIERSVLNAARFSLTIQAVDDGGARAALLGDSENLKEASITIKLGPAPESPGSFISQPSQLSLEVRRKLIARYENLPVFLPEHFSQGARSELIGLVENIGDDGAIRVRLLRILDDFARVEARAETVPLTLKDILHLIEDLRDLGPDLNRNALDRMQRYIDALLAYYQDSFEYSSVRKKVREDLEKARKILSPMEAGVGSHAAITQFLDELDHSGISAEYAKAAGSYAARSVVELRTFLGAIDRFESLVGSWQYQLPAARTLSVLSEEGDLRAVLGIVDGRHRVYGISSQPFIFTALDGSTLSLNYTCPPRGLGTVTLVVAESNKRYVDELRDLPNQLIFPTKVPGETEAGEILEELTLGTRAYAAWLRNILKETLKAIFGNPALGAKVMKLLKVDSQRVTVVFGSALALVLALQGHRVVSADTHVDRQDALWKSYRSIETLVGGQGGQVMFAEGKPESARLGRYLQALRVELLVSMEDPLPPETLASLTGASGPIKLYVGPQPGSWDDYQRRLKAGGWRIEESREVPAPRQDKTAVNGRFFRLIPVPGFARIPSSSPPALPQQPAEAPGQKSGSPMTYTMRSLLRAA